MTFTWSGDPAASTLEAVRREIGDTDSTDQLLQDAEIEYAISQERTVFGAAARCCEWLARAFAREADRAMGPMRISLSQKHKAYESLAKDLRNKEVGQGTLYAGGISEAERTVDADDSDLTPKVFKKKQMDSE